MRQIRTGVFETNSSSVHSICISKEPVDRLPSSIRFYLGEYGWENATVDPADYLYTAIMCAYYDDEQTEKLNKLKEILDAHSIKYTFEEPKYYTGKYGTWVDNACIDHCEGIYEFVETVLADEEMLLRCLFHHESCVYTGNDNQDSQPNGCNISDNEYWDSQTGKDVPNPYHDETKFDYFRKGN